MQHAQGLWQDVFFHYGKLSIKGIMERYCLWKEFQVTAYFR
jgi:hypothetical protein